jgi:EpsI family protein
VEDGVIDRRGLLIGVSCAAAGGAAFALKPRRAVSLLGAHVLAKVVPARFGRWISADVGDPLALNPDSLQGKLYNQLLTRLYTDQTSGHEVLTLMAHGERQSDDLQLHRPEVCYPAFGYTLMRNEPATVALVPKVTIPGRRLIAKLEDRQESIFYWSRMGEALPTSGAEQREVRFQNAVHGTIPDGMLCRFSALSQSRSVAETDDFLHGFVRDLVLHTQAANRAIIIGTDRARALVNV